MRLSSSALKRFCIPTKATAEDYSRRRVSENPPSKSMKMRIPEHSGLLVGYFARAENGEAEAMARNMLRYIPFPVNI